MRGVPRLVLVAGVLVVVATLAPVAEAICPKDWAQCYRNRAALETTVYGNPLGVVTLDIPQGSFDADGRLVGQPGDNGTVFVELLQPGVDAVPATLVVSAPKDVVWDDSTSRTFSFTGFHNETFHFHLGPGASGTLAVNLNATLNTTLAPVVLEMTAAGKVAPVPLPPDVVAILLGTAGLGVGAAGGWYLRGRRIP